MMRPSTFFFLVRRGIRNLGKHWAMTFVCILSLSVCMTLNTFASLAEVNVDSMVNYLGSQNETVVYLDPECDDATAQAVGEKLSAMPGVTNKILSHFVDKAGDKPVCNPVDTFVDSFLAIGNWAT